MKTSHHFKSFVEWEIAGIAAGYDGPFKISGQPHMQQFVKSGTEGLFNAENGTGFLNLSDEHSNDKG